MNERRKNVLESARKLFLERGINETSIQDIIDDSGISKRTFYNYFSSKTECMIELLEQARHDIYMKRQEEALNRDLADPETLIQQLSTIMTINREQNLIVLFEQIWHYGDEELRAVAYQYRLRELDWLSKRFVDIFGPDMSPVAYECAILFHGMLQHIVLTHKSVNDQPLPPRKIARSVLSHIEALIPSILKNHTALLDEQTLHLIRQKEEKPVIQKEDLIIALTQFVDELSAETLTQEELDVTHALLEELKREPIRKSVINLLLPSFHQTFRTTTLASQSRTIAQSIWQLIQEKK